MPSPTHAKQSESSQPWSTSCPWSGLLLIRMFQLREFRQISSSAPIESIPKLPSPRIFPPQAARPGPVPSLLSSCNYQVYFRTSLESNINKLIQYLLKLHQDSFRHLHHLAVVLDPHFTPKTPKNVHI